MSEITGKITNFGGARLTGMAPLLHVIPQGEGTFASQLLSTSEILVNLSEPDDSFNFSIISSDELRPPRPYSFRLRWLNGEGVPIGEDWWSDVWVPEGTWEVSDLLGDGLSPTRVFWQADEPNPWPVGAYWANTVTGDVNLRKA